MIAAEEFAARQRRLGAAAAERGLDGVLAFCRGGGTHDRTADVLWLTGLAAPQPFVADLPGFWRAAGHVAAFVRPDGHCTAVVEADELQAPPVVDAVIVSADVVAAAADCARGCGRVGVLGSDVVAAAWWAELARRSGADLVVADELGTALRLAKSPAEQELLRAGGALGSRAMDAALAAAQPGAPEAAVAAAFFQAVTEAGGAVYDVVVSSGPHAGTLGPSGGPAGAARWSTRTLAAGDLVRLDAYGSVGGYLFDFARTKAVGDRPTADQRDLMAALRDAVLAGVEALRPGARLAEVAHRCEAVLAASAHAQRHGVPAHTMSGFWGHGLGLGFEPPWIGPDSDVVVEAGWCLAVERRAAVPGLGGAQYEENVLIGEAGAELLTRTASG